MIGSSLIGSVEGGFDLVVVSKVTGGLFRTGLSEDESG